MAAYDMISPTESMGALPVARTVTPADLKEVLAEGIADFRAMPTHVVFLCLIYPVIGLLIGRAAFGYEFLPLLFPLAAGFALIGPFAAIGLYELSRRREQGLDTSWTHAFDVIHSPSLRPIVTVGLLLLGIFALWIAVAHAIYVTHFGYREPESLMTFAEQVLTTAPGHSLILVGNTVGLVFAVLAMALSVISFPLLLDRHIGAAAAMFTSVRVVLHNPVTMALWGLIVAAGLIAGFLLFFVGLAVVIPVLGHATWHLYRRALEPDPNPRPPIEAKDRGRHYAADFPASLFSSTKVDRR